MRSLVTSIFLYACESWALTAELQRRIQVRQHRVLGVILDEELKWQSHIDSVCKKVARNLFLLGQPKHYVSTDCRKMFFKAHLLAHINYTFYKRAAKLILPEQSLSTTAKLRKLDIFPSAETIHVQYSCAYDYGAYGLGTLICK